MHHSLILQFRRGCFYRLACCAFPPLFLTQDCDCIADKINGFGSKAILSFCCWSSAGLSGCLWRREWYRLEFCSLGLKFSCREEKCWDPRWGKCYLKRESAADHSVEDDSAAPKIHLKAVISLPCYHFRSSIARTSACSLQFLFLCAALNQTFLLIAYLFLLNIHAFFLLYALGWQFWVGIRQPKVHDLDILLIVKQHVLWLEISMHDAQPMQIIHSIDNLMKEATWFLLSQPASHISLLLLFCYVIKELASSAVLHHKE